MVSSVGRNTQRSSPWAGGIRRKPLKLNLFVYAFFFFLSFFLSFFVAEFAKKEEKVFDNLRQPLKVLGDIPGEHPTRSASDGGGG